MLSVLLLSGGRRRKLFFSLELWLPKQETVVLCCHFFFFKDFCTLSLTLGSDAGEWGWGVPLKFCSHRMTCPVTWRGGFTRLCCAKEDAQKFRLGNISNNHNMIYIVCMT